ncbi:zinc finger protein-like 1 [Erpetoichthys calabaricus]|uniref:Zinc finger protein-like 1 n=1 Tax=Erpetoichthys calabaricus TaxID=27687 RepID=A0A8C4RZV4_ERPCA|nr:zinc finger protein-like 1 [Erpetoichthys calabaricus]
MGLCKCPKRKVTNLFCFEHRVNVCEHCLVSNHSKCIVQSYLQWLQDSDYNPNCRLCLTPLSEKETTRLVCYDVFHWSCLNSLAGQLPVNTAPAGYQCPSCQGPIFPPSNLVSPVAEVLREKLSTVNWARAGLGLSLIEENEAVHYTESHDVTDYTDWSTFNSSAVHSSETITESSQSTALTYSSRSNAPSHSDYTMSLNNGGVRESHAVINMSGTAANESITIHAASSPRKMYDTRDTENSSVTQIDFDDDKYRRRSALNWFAQILKNRSSSRKRPRSMKQRVLMVLIIGIIGFFTLILIMSKLGRASTENDPNLDPLLNPNIRVGQE